MKVFFHIIMRMSSKNFIDILKYANAGRTHDSRKHPIRKGLQQQLKVESRCNLV